MHCFQNAVAFETAGLSRLLRTLFKEKLGCQDHYDEAAPVGNRIAEEGSDMRLGGRSGVEDYPEHEAGGGTERERVSVPKGATTVCGHIAT